MTIAGVDYSFSRPSVGDLKAAGISFACRYLSSDGTVSYHNDKDLTAAEASALLGGGIAIVLNYESTAQFMLGGYQAGLRVAANARSQASSIGAPHNIPIYYSADYNATPDQVATTLDFLHGAADAEGNKALVGVYGGIAVVKAALDAGFFYAWQTYAWSGGQWDSRAVLRQTHNDQTLAGASVDFDEAMSASYGQWLPSTPVDPSPPDIPRPLLREGASGPWASTLQRSLMLAGQAPGAVDGNFGARTLAALESFQRARGIAVDGICGPITWSALKARTVKVQTALTASGISVGGIDGMAGPLTADAVLRFQAAHHLTQDGIVGPITSSALGIS